MSKPTNITGRESAQFLLRLPEGMRDRLRSQAQANGRTMNAEVVERLERSLALGRVEQAIHRSRSAIEQLELWYRLRGMADDVLRIKDLSGDPDALARLLTSLEEEAQLIVRETKGLSTVTQEVVSNVVDAATKLSATATRRQARKLAPQDTPKQ